MNSIIFDLGKVVFDYSFSIAYHQWSKHCGIKASVIKEANIFDDYFELFEKNEISSAEFKNHVAAKAGMKISFNAFFNGWNKIFLNAYPNIASTLSNLQKNYRLVALTNTNIEHCKIWKTKYKKELSYFENIFCSCDIKARKPDKQSFEIVLDYLNCDPKNALFLDDNKINILGAENLGINAVHVTSQEQIMADLHVRLQQFN